MADHKHASHNGASAPDHGHDHGHSHIHDHNVIPWTAFRTNRMLQAVLGLIVVSAVATIVLLISLWPGGGATDEAVSQGALVGLGSERFGATVIDVIDQACSYSTSTNPQDCRIIEFEVDEGRFAGQQFQFGEANLQNDAFAPDLDPGDGIIAAFEPSTEFWFYGDRDRRGMLVVLAAVFALFVIALGRLRGVAALAAMAITVGVLVWFVAPSVLDGNDPLLVAVVAAAAIAFVSLYLTHGLTPTTTVALAGTLISLVLTLGLASFFFALANFTGLATDEGTLLPFIATDLKLSSLLLGGAVLGTLGALDDVTVTQVSTVAELHRRSPELGVGQLVASGIRVGRDHIASTVNTLLLAYAGASMPLLLLFAASDQSLDKVASSELVSVEIVRTLTGSVGLVAAVPITTVLAALVTQTVRGTADETDADNADDETAKPFSLDEPIEMPDTPPVEPEPKPEPEPEAEPSWDDFAPDADARDF